METFEEFYDNVNAELKRAAAVAQGDKEAAIKTEAAPIEIGQTEGAVLEDVEHVEEHVLPEGTAPIDMTEEVVNKVIEQLESRGFDEGIDFLVTEDGKILANDRCPKSQLVAEGLKVGDLW